MAATRRVPLFCLFCSCERPGILINRLTRRRSGDGFLPTTLKWSLHGRQHPEILLERHFSGFGRIRRHSVPGIPFWQHLNRFFRRFQAARVPTARAVVVLGPVACRADENGCRFVTAFAGHVDLA